MWGHQDAQVNTRWDIWGAGLGDADEEEGKGRM